MENWKPKAWLLDTVRPRAEVIKEYSAKNKPAHFGTLMDLCHEKHSELSRDRRSYKGRVIFRGDQVRDESGFSASHTAAAKLLDAIARMDGNDGTDSDAIGAYTQNGTRRTGHVD